MATRPTRAPTSPDAWRDRIVGHDAVDPATLRANAANWRMHPKAQRQAIEAALGGVGWVQSVMVNKRTGFIVDGHLRVEAALERGEPTLPVVYVDLTEAEELLVLATLDPIGAMATADTAKLAELLASLPPIDEALAAMLAELSEHNALRRQGLTDPDAVPDIGAEIYVKPGDLWVLGGHRLICGDSMDAAAVARVLDGAQPRLLVTDPPYGVELDPTWRDGVYNGLGPAEAPYMRGEGYHNTTISGDTVVDWSGAFALVPSLEVAFVWHAGVHAAEVGQGLEAIDFEIRAQIIWAKTHFAMSRSAYQWQHEPCWYAVRKGKSAGWIGDHHLSTVWTLASPKQIMSGSAEERFDHPTQKPIECMERPIANHAGDVYEPFSGSGTTIIAAERLARRCFAVEIDPRYVQVAIERWQAFTGQRAERIA